MVDLLPAKGCPAACDCPSVRNFRPVWWRRQMLQLRITVAGAKRSLQPRLVGPCSCLLLRTFWPACTWPPPKPNTPPTMHAADSSCSDNTLESKGSSACVRWHQLKSKPCDGGYCPWHWRRLGVGAVPDILWPVLACAAQEANPQELWC